MVWLIILKDRNDSMSNIESRLHLTDCYLIDFDMKDIITFVKNGIFTREDVEKVIDEYKAVDGNTYQEIKHYEILERKQHAFLESLRQAYLDGKIKTNSSECDTGNVVLEKKSFKSVIKYVGKKHDINLGFLKYENDYYIKSFHGQEYELNLSHIVSDENYQDLLKRNHESYLLNLLRVYLLSQFYYRKKANKYSMMYKEISDFQKGSNFIVSDKILNNEELSQDELDDVYRVFKKVLESTLYAHSLSVSINKKYNK